VKNPSKLVKTTNEIRSKFKSIDEITLANVNSLRYLNAVFTEGLRLWPPGPETMRRETNSQGSYINGDLIPPKVSCLIVAIRFRLGGDRMSEY
jgi:cytochrome P450